MNANTHNQTWSLITGASSGFGVDYAHLLAKSGSNLIITARREDRLLELKKTIERDYQVTCHVIPLDLSDAHGPDLLLEKINELGIKVDNLINNAGFGIHGKFTDVSWEETQKMLNLNITSLTHLTKIFADDMKKRGKGNILLVSSIGAYQPCPTYAAYGASKSYVLNFGEAINEELQGTGVKVSVLSPGVTSTEFLQVAGQELTFYQKLFLMKSRPVAAFGLKAMFKGTKSVVPGFFNRLVLFTNRLTPRWMQTKVAYMLMK